MVETSCGIVEADITVILHVESMDVVVDVGGTSKFDGAAALPSNGFLALEDPRRDVPAGRQIEVLPP